MIEPDDVDLDRVWINVATEVWRREPRRFERIATRLLKSPGLARALLTTPSLLLPWVIASVAVLAAGVVAQLGGREPVVWVLVPAIAAVGIAYAYGPGIDPAWELCASMAVSDRMVLLTRAVAVFALDALLGLLASAATIGTAAGTGTAQLTFAWLLPMTAVCALALAVAVATKSANAGAGVGLATWIIVVLAGGLAGTPSGSTGSPGTSAAVRLTAVITDANLYLPYLAVAACCVVAVIYATRPQRGIH